MIPQEQPTAENTTAEHIAVLESKKQQILADLQDPTINKNDTAAALEAVCCDIAKARTQHDRELHAAITKNKRLISLTTLPCIIFPVLYLLTSFFIPPAALPPAIAAVVSFATHLFSRFQVSILSSAQTHNRELREAIRHSVAPSAVSDPKKNDPSRQTANPTLSSAPQYTSSALRCAKLAANTVKASKKSLPSPSTAHDEKKSDRHRPSTNKKR